MLNKRFVRISIGIILVILLVVSFVPNIYQSTASDGVISAHTTTLKSPIEGVLHFNSTLHHGQFFRKGEEIGKVVNSASTRPSSMNSKPNTAPSPAAFKPCPSVSPNSTN